MNPIMPTNPTAYFLIGISIGLIIFIIINFIISYIKIEK